MNEPKNRSVFIPPLNLTPKIETTALLGRILGVKNDDTKSRNTVEALKQNGQFLREKSLYRCYISKNCSPDQLERQEGKRKEGEKRGGVEEVRQKLGRILSSKDMKQYGAGEQLRQGDARGDKHFKRKNHLSRTLICQTKQQADQCTRANEEEESDKSLIDLLNAGTDLRLLKSSTTVSFNQLAEKESEIACLKQKNQLIGRQNSQLKQQLMQKDQQVHQLRSEIQMLEREKGELQKEVARYVSRMHCSAAEEARLLAQLELKEKAIRQLESGYKYIEIENTVLNHAKSQCSLQLTLIQHLEREKKVLEEKVRLIYDMSRKKKQAKAPRLSESSDVSLTFSIDKQEADCLEQSCPELSPKSIKVAKREHTERPHGCVKYR